MIMRRRRFMSKPIAPIAPSQDLYSSDRSVRRRAQFTYNLQRYFNSVQSYRRERRRVIYNNVLTGSSLIFRIAIACTALAFIFFMLNKPFDFEDFAYRMSTANFGGFDFVAKMSEVDSWVNNLPDVVSWLGYIIKPVAFLSLSIGYLLTVVVMFLSYIF